MLWCRALAVVASAMAMSEPDCLQTVSVLEQMQGDLAAFQQSQETEIAFESSGMSFLA